MNIFDQAQGAPHMVVRECESKKREQRTVPLSVGYLGNQGRSCRLLDREKSAFEYNDSGLEGEEGVVLADADVLSGFEGRAALAHENRACLDLLSAPGL